jgi:hypothetical protein
MTWQLMEGDVEYYRFHSGEEGTGAVTIWTRSPADVMLVAYPVPVPSEILSVIAEAFDYNRDPNGNYTGVPRDPASWKAMKSDWLFNGYQFVHFVFLIRNVSRYFTHQLVRYRIATYTQQSLRMVSFKNDLAFLLPLKPPDLWRATEHVLRSVELARELERNGAPPEVSRSVIPHSILTHIYVGWSLQTLLSVYRQRSSPQAQKHEWPVVLRQMVQEIIAVDPDLEELFDGQA